MSLSVSIKNTSSGGTACANLFDLHISQSKFLQTNPKTDDVNESEEKYWV